MITEDGDKWKTFLADPSITGEGVEVTFRIPYLLCIVYVACVSDCSQV